MADMVNVAVDAMGGDNAPDEIVKGAVEAVNADERVKIFLVGRREAIEKALAGQTYDSTRVEIVHAEEVIETAEPPVMAIRRKKDSSIVKAMYMVKGWNLRRVCIGRFNRSGSGWRAGTDRTHQGG